MTPIVGFPAGPNPLQQYAYSYSEPHLSGYRLVLGFMTLEQVQAAQAYLAQLAGDAKRCQQDVIEGQSEVSPE